MVVGDSGDGDRDDLYKAAGAEVTMDSTEWRQPRQGTQRLERDLGQWAKARLYVLLWGLTTLIDWLPASRVQSRLRHQVASAIMEARSAGELDL